MKVCELGSATASLFLAIWVAALRSVTGTRSKRRAYVRFMKSLTRIPHKSSTITLKWRPRWAEICSVLVQEKQCREALLAGERDEFPAIRLVIGVAEHEIQCQRGAVRAHAAVNGGKEALADVLTRLQSHLNSPIDDLLPHRWQPQV